MEHCYAGKRGVPWADVLLLPLGRAAQAPGCIASLLSVTGGAWTREGGPTDLNDEPRANERLRAPLYLRVSCAHSRVALIWSAGMLVVSSLTRGRAWRGAGGEGNVVPLRLSKGVAW